MPISLSKEDRKLLENITAKARILSESACRAALENLAVHEGEYRAHMSVDQRLLRNRLRARGRAVGDKINDRSSIQEIRYLAELAAYEHWHRLLFTRFLTENHLLITDEANGNVPVSLEDCEELAPELGARDGLDLACRFASLTLPGVFRRDDPVLDLPIALNDQVELRKLLASLPSECFRADDSLGWTYQFWQAQRKEEVNASGNKIGADELSPVTQLFTEDYMVEFLLHNTLGAWWAGKLGPITAATEEEARARSSLSAKNGLGIIWSYLRFIQDEKSKTWSPAAGTFDGWPKQAKLIKFLDPCMGSGHFLVFALPLLVRMRMEEENLSLQDAVIAVLAENIHGLELDERCSQIAAFNLALTAWKIGGYQPLPSLHLACSGLAPNTRKADWVALGGESDRLRRGMERLYNLFEKAPVLGSLINPRAGEADLLVAGFDELQPLLEQALMQESQDDTAHEMAVTARGLAKAAEILSGQFTLVATNVPYLARGKQCITLQEYSGTFASNGKMDLATVFLHRCRGFLARYGVVSVVTPQNWLFLSGYTEMRIDFLQTMSWLGVGRLGPGAFETISGEIVNTSLLILDGELPSNETSFLALDASANKPSSRKAQTLQQGDIAMIRQSEQVKNPDCRIVLAELAKGIPLRQLTSALSGCLTGDGQRFVRLFWEIPRNASDWEFHQSTVPDVCENGGKSEVIFWERECGEMFRLVESVKHLNHVAQNWLRGKPNWKKKGVVISQIGNLPATIYLGDIYDCNCCAIVPNNPEHLPALWAFCASGLFTKEVRKINQKLNVTTGTLLDVPFDLEHWQKVAAEKYPDGLPMPFSSDPTQWLFNGHPAGSDQPLHVAVARLLGYQWPRQTGSSFPDCPALGPDGLEKLADDDGIVCLPPLNREQPAASRLRQLLTAALGSYDERALIASAGLKGSNSKTLEEWLRDEFFEQHAKLFHDRPFIWHLWDGRPDGFHALVNYHKLDHALLQKLTYAYLGNWIQQQSDDAKSEKPGAAERLGAARTLQTELAKILEGQAPYDIFVRWKPLAKQAQGWNPDLNDGVRMNIRPFITATDIGKKGTGVLRSKLNIKWDKDRGKEPQRDKAEYPWFWCEEEPGTDPEEGKVFSGNRWNNVHLTLAVKQKAKS